MRIGIIGHFGGDKKFMDGQTVKTVTLYQAMMHKQINAGKIDRIDTYYIKHNPIRFVMQLLGCICRDRKIVILLSSNGRRVLFPVMYFLQKYLHKEVYHDTIGGRLAREVNENAKWKKYVSAFSGNWMESKELVDRLQKLGVDNAVLVPNFKSIPLLTEKELPQTMEKPYRFVIFSRVMQKKGVTDAIRAVKLLNEKMGAMTAALDIYGPVEQDYTEELKQELAQAGECCRYGGVIEPNQSVAVLQNYYALLFPTHWKNEGMPGTIIDALSAGVPVIAREWQYCREMITADQTGLIYPFEQPERLLSMLEYAVTHEAELMKMRRNCVQSAQKYAEETVLQQICDLMQLDAV